MRQNIQSSNDQKTNVNSLLPQLTFTHDIAPLSRIHRHKSESGCGVANNSTKRLSDVNIHQSNAKINPLTKCKSYAIVGKSEELSLSEQA